MIATTDDEFACRAELYKGLQPWRCDDDEDMTIRFSDLARDQKAVALRAYVAKFGTDAFDDVMCDVPTMMLVEAYASDEASDYVRRSFASLEVQAALAIDRAVAEGRFEL